jgi:hypothetical protein
MNGPGHLPLPQLVGGACVELQRNNQSFGQGALCLVLNKQGNLVYLTCSHVAFGQYGPGAPPGTHAPGGHLLHPLINGGIDIGTANAADDGLDQTLYPNYMDVAIVRPSGLGYPKPRTIYPDWTVIEVVMDIPSLKNKTVFKVGPDTGETTGIVLDFVPAGQDVATYGPLPNILIIEGVNNQPFAKEGDSGAPIFMKIGANPNLAALVGIVVAVDDPATVPNSVTAYAHPLAGVFVNEDGSSSGSLGLDRI